MFESVEYRPIPDFPGYRVGNDGSVWTRKRRGQKKDRPGDWKPMYPKINKHRGNYKRVTFRHKGKCFKYSPYPLHRLILELFVGPCPGGMEACHNNGDPTDNRLENLRWDTRKSNRRDQDIHGTSCYGSRLPQAKLKEEDIQQIRKLAKVNGLGPCAISRLYGVTSSTIHDVLHGKSWAHVSS